MIAKDAHVCIVGAGCFGLSTAHHLQARGYTNITLLERAATHPAPDAASTDINKIVRSAYSDHVYVSLAREAIELWKDESVFGDSYRESGVLVLAADVSFLGNSNAPLENERAAGAPIRELRSGAEVADALPASVRPNPPPEGRAGYLNPQGGWANAEGAIKKLADLVTSRGAKLLTGQEVIGLSHDAFGGVSGVRVKGKSEPVEADYVIIASGSWTVSSFPDPELGLNSRMVATGNSVATIQLSPEEVQRYQDIPVILDFDTGFYCFPPNDQGIMKFARHYAGVINPDVIPEHDLDETPQPVSSVPDHRRPDTSKAPNATSHSAIPRDVANLCRAVIREIFPELGNRQFDSGRMCWYTDTADENWIIDFHPKYQNVLLVTGGSGHGFKFLPNIGRLAVDRLEGKLDKRLQDKFALGLDNPAKQVTAPMLSRLKTLDDAGLVFAEELDPTVPVPSLKEDLSWRETLRSH
ncbi:FAD dependent oxidoreductase [Auricularia subglabra TFB-10046 SS5]|uniref:FAD dependent oxidoreductase n=1 Tax=Auricularia subglabra (strain TFB-10046 / SS5) TaxID=717982 RepID=J0LII7_AURST|nr:FAD dependent oxidoreductase [Auricularia subglabra TFB-10046 SS5]